MTPSEQPHSSRTTASRAPRRSVPLCAAIATLIGIPCSCGSQSAPPTALQRLLGRTWETEGDWFGSAHQPPTPPLVETDFDADWPTGFLAITDPSLIDRRKEESPPRDSRPAAVRDGALRFPDDLGIVCFQAPGAALTSYALRVQVRLDGERAAAPFVAIAELAAPLAAGFSQEDIAELFSAPATNFTRDPLFLGHDRGRGDVRHGFETLADGSEEHRFDFTTGFATQGLLVGMIGGTQAMDGGARDIVFEAVCLREVPLYESLDGPGEELAFPNKAQHYRPELRQTLVRRDGESRPSILLRPGSSVCCRFPAPARGRLTLGLAVAPERRLTRDGAARWPVTLRLGPVGGPAVHQEEFHLETSADRPVPWSDLTLAIESTPQSEWELRVEAPGPSTPGDPLFALGSPLVIDATRRPTRPSIVVVSIDTLRFDRLGRVVNGASITPRLDALRAEATEFRTALANASYTLPSHVSLFTSQRLREHRVELGTRLDPARTRSITELLAGEGYVTAAFTAGGMLNPDFCGIERGFDRYTEIDPLLSDTDRMPLSTPRMRGGEEFNREIFRQHRMDRTVLPFLEAHQDVPFLLFLHTYLVHNYQPDAAIAEQFDVDEVGVASTLGHVTPSVISRLQLPDAPRKVKRSIPLDREADLPYLERLYDATVHQADAAVGRLLDGLRQWGLDGRTIVVVTSDHGEEFLEHGDLCHARTLYDEMLKVPLLVKVPGRAAATIGAPVESIDVVPTLLGRLGIDRDRRMRGRDLFDGPGPVITTHGGVHTLASSKWAARHERMKLVVTTPDEGGLPTLQLALRSQLEELGYLEAIDESEARLELYDLGRDPFEQQNLWPTVDALDEEQTALLEALKRAIEEPPPAPAPREGRRP